MQLLPYSTSSILWLQQQEAHTTKSYGSEDSLNGARFILQTGASVSLLKAPAAFSAELVRC